MTAVTRPWALSAIAIVDADRGLVSDPINKIRRRRSPLVRHGQDSRRAWDRLKLGRYREMNQEIDRNEHCRHKNPGQRPHYLRARPFVKTRNGVPGAESTARVSATMRS